MLALSFVQPHCLNSDVRISAHQTLAMKPRSLGILLLHRGAALLPSFGPDLQVAAAETLEKQGIEVVTNASVTEVEGDTVSCLEILSIYIYTVYIQYIFLLCVRFFGPFGSIWLMSLGPSNMSVWVMASDASMILMWQTQ
jgi:hypothetical protein